MKYSLMMQILFELLSKKSVSASYLANKYEISTRSVYRYMEAIEGAGVPIYTNRGQYGGFSIIDTYKLPYTFLTVKEYEQTIKALQSFEASVPNKTLQTAIVKLQSAIKNQSSSMDIKSGNLIIDAGPWGDAIGYKTKLTVIQKCIDENYLLEIKYHDRNGEITTRNIEPHLILFKQGIWYVYAFCHLRNDFRFFKTGRIESATILDEKFSRKEVNSDELPLNFWENQSNTVEVCLKVDGKIISDVEEWLGVENVIKEKEYFFANASLPLDEGLVSKIMSFGNGIEVIAPIELKENIKTKVDELAKIYNN